jgi:uncharacterized protein (TIGR02001 family)
MKKILLVASLVLAATPALAQQYSLEGRVSGMTDYRVRGISRSDENPALQGNAQINVPVSGLTPFVGGQATTVDLSTEDGGADVEGILFGGVAGNYAGIDRQGKLAYNAYPGSDADDLDYWEFELTGDYDFGPFVAGLTWAMSPEYINESGSSLYYGADIAVPLYNFTNMDLAARGHIGFQFIDDESRYTEDYTDWSLGLWYNWADYDVDFGL